MDTNNYPHLSDRIKQYCFRLMYCSFHYL
jgi:hypothetical protein